MDVNSNVGGATAMSTLTLKAQVGLGQCRLRVRHRREEDLTSHIYPGYVYRTRELCDLCRQTVAYTIGLRPRIADAFKHKPKRISSIEDFEGVQNALNRMLVWRARGITVLKPRI